MKMHLSIFLTVYMVSAGYGLAIAGQDNGSDKATHYQHGKHGKLRGKARLKRMIEMLDLNEQQITKIRAINLKYKPRKMELREKRKATRLEIREAMHEHTINKDNIKVLAKKMGSHITDKIILRSEVRSEVYKVLTKEQRDKKKALRMGHHGRGHGKCEYHKKHHN